jgi:hypothetical protein
MRWLGGASSLVPWVQILDHVGGGTHTASYVLPVLALDSPFPHKMETLRKFSTATLTLSSIQIINCATPIEFRSDTTIEQNFRSNSMHLWSFYVEVIQFDNFIRGINQDESGAFLSKNHRTTGLTFKNLFFQAIFERLVSKIATKVLDHCFLSLSVSMFQRLYLVPHHYQSITLSLDIIISAKWTPNMLYF